MKTNKIKQIKIGKYKIPSYIKNLNVDEKVFPVNHYSYSMFSKFCSNSLMAKIKYINKDSFETIDGASLVLGKAVHKAVEIWLGKDETGELANKPEAERYSLALLFGIDFINNYNESYLRFTSTMPTKAVLVEKFSFAFQEYIKVLKANKDLIYENIWSIEDNIETSIKFDDYKLPISIKGYMDLCYEDEKGVVVLDHKIVSRFSDEDKIDGSKLIQAGFYYFLALKKTGKAPYKIIFNEVKHSVNKDKTEPQIKSYELIYKNNAMIFELFFRLYYDITSLLCGKAVFLPNINDMYDGDVALISYIQGLDTEAKERLFEKDKVDNITDFLNKQVEKKGVDKIYKNTLKAFISSNNIIDTKDMKKEEIIKLRFAQHGVAVNYIDTIKGLAVDLMRFDVGVGVKLSKLHSFLPDIEMSIGKSGARILAPIPNTQYVGVEVPKEKRSFIKEKPTGSGYDVEIGKDLYGEVIRYDLRTAPHILIGGASGSGKTYFLQSLATQIINSDDCELVILDPKQIDFQDYAGVADVKTEKEEIENFMFELVVEMESRYQTLKSKKKKSIAGTDYKYKFVIIDEYSDLVMGKGGKDVADNVKRIAQKGRACGIHLILATQRPSVKVIDGDIKVNFPIKICLKVPKAVDSNVILGEEGAEKLLGKGDGLISGIDGGAVQRFQAFSHF